MGITGLIPFLEKSSKKTNISDFAGGTVAVDTYCWLHKGAFSCADKIVMGQPTDGYIKYCLKFVNMLLSHNIKPILVFDGRHLPAKAETEVKRRESREANRKRAAELIKMGNSYEGKNLLRRSLDVSHSMALEVIKACQAQNVDCIVAPYEADAQLAYLSISGIADVIITEDSDLTLFGCKKIFFKMDLYGNGVLVEQDRLHLAMGLSLNNFNLDKFRYMCILSGCDYLASLPGIGLGKACKFIVKNTNNNIYNALQRLGSSLNMKTLTVTKEYRDSFIRALVTFKHQLVFCPMQRKQVRLNPPTADVTSEQLEYAGTEVDSDLAYQLALGNCDPFTYKKLHNFDPDKHQPLRSNSWSEIPTAKHLSIWSSNFTVKKTTVQQPRVTLEGDKKVSAKISSTRGQVVVMKTHTLKKEVTPGKRTFEECDMSVDEIVKLYKQPETNPTSVVTENSPFDEPTSPVLVRRSNPFRKNIDSNETSPSLLQRARRRLPIKSRLRPTVIDDTAIAQSEFFAPKPKAVEIKTEEAVDVVESMASKLDKEEFKENMEVSLQRIIIPETEDFEDSILPNNGEDVEKDSGYKESSVERDINTSAMSCDDSISEKEPLHSIDDNQKKNEKITENECDDFSSRTIESEFDNFSSMIVEPECEFSITRQIFSESRSSLFQYQSPVPEKKLKRESFSQSSQSLSQTSKVSSNRRSARNTSKKTATIQGQQSLLNMFGFSKKNTLMH